MYIDPAMYVVEGVARGELKDDRWHIRYWVPAGGSGLATIWVTDLWTGDRAHVLQEPPFRSDGRVVRSRRSWIAGHH